MDKDNFDLSQPSYCTSIFSDSTKNSYFSSKYENIEELDKYISESAIKKYKLENTNMATLFNSDIDFSNLTLADISANTISSGTITSGRIFPNTTYPGTFTVSSPLSTYKSDLLTQIHNQQSSVEPSFKDWVITRIGDRYELKNLVTLQKIVVNSGSMPFYDYNSKGPEETKSKDPEPPKTSVQLELF